MSGDHTGAQSSGPAAASRRRPSQAVLGRSSPTPPSRSSTPDAALSRRSARRSPRHEGARPLHHPCRPDLRPHPRRVRRERDQDRQPRTARAASHSHHDVNRGKEQRPPRPQDRRRARRCSGVSLEDADVMRPELPRSASMKRLGIDYDVRPGAPARHRLRDAQCLRGRSALGPSRPGWEQLAQAATGMQMRGTAATAAPVLQPFPVNDYGTGIHGCVRGRAWRCSAPSRRRVRASTSDLGSRPTPAMTAPVPARHAGLRRQDAGTSREARIHLDAGPLQRLYRDLRTAGSSSAPTTPSGMRCWPRSASQ